MLEETIDGVLCQHDHSLVQHCYRGYNNKNPLISGIIRAREKSDFEIIIIIIRARRRRTFLGIFEGKHMNFA